MVFYLHLGAQAPLLDSSSHSALGQILSEAQKNNHNQVLDLYRKYKYQIRSDIMLFHEMIKFMLLNDKMDLIDEMLKSNPFLMSQHNEQALYFYYLGVSQMLSERGWPNYKQAEKSLNTAAVFLRRSAKPDYGFFSDLENARGYLSITARGISTSEQKDLVTIVRHEFIRMAIEHFRDALTYNPENEIAQQNLDTLISKLEERGLPIPPHHHAQHVLSGLQIAFDSLNLDSLQNTSVMPLLDYTLLPNNYNLILTQLSQYDEILLCLDLSGSMDDPVPWGPEISKFAVAQQLSIFLVAQLKKETFIGIISVGRDCDENAALNHSIASASRIELATRLEAVRPHGHTPLNTRLKMAGHMFSSRKNRKLVFLLSDGMDTCDELPNLCGTAANLAANGIDLSVFSFINETLDEESRAAYAVYNCMVNPSQGVIYTINEGGGLEDEIDYEPVSNNILLLPPMDTSVLWKNNHALYQFKIEGVIPPIKKIIDLDKMNSDSLKMN